MKEEEEEQREVEKKKKKTMPSRRIKSLEKKLGLPTYLEDVHACAYYIPYLIAMT